MINLSFLNLIKSPFAPWSKTKTSFTICSSVNTFVNSVSSCFLVYGDNKFLKGKALILSDCGVIEKPDAQTLSSIAEASVESAKAFKIGVPKVAFLSYSTKGSAKSEDVTKVREAYEIFKKKSIYYKIH